MSNLNMTWGKRQLWFIVPIMLLSFIPMARIFWFRGDITKELKISEVQKRMNGDFIEIVGLITNTGSHNWSNVTIEAEFFDAAGNFVDEAQEYMRSNVARGAKEHFKIKVRPSTTVIAEENKMELKIAGGHTMPF